MHDGSWMLFGSGFMWIFWLIVIVLAVVVVKVFMKDFGKGSTCEQETDIEILNKRYARGEINGDELQRRHKELEA